MQQSVTTAAASPAEHLLVELAAALLVGVGDDARQRLHVRHVGDDTLRGAGAAAGWAGVR